MDFYHPRFQQIGSSSTVRSEAYRYQQLGSFFTPQADGLSFNDFRFQQFGSSSISSLLNDFRF
jgi:hypothetical protein